MSHPMFTLLCAVLLAAAMAALEDRGPRERALVAARVFAWCVVATIGGSWLMHAIHG